MLETAHLIERLRQADSYGLNAYACSLVFSRSMDPAPPDLTFPAFRGIEGAVRQFRRGSAWFACLLFALIVGLPVLAYASPPDPSWGHGVYDDADLDDIVCSIIASSGLVEDLCAASQSPHFTLTDAELPQNDRSIASSSLASPQPRAPPPS